MAEPSFLTGAAEKPDSLVSSSKERSEDSVSKISLCSSPYLAYSRPKRALRPGRSSFSNWAREIAILHHSLYASGAVKLMTRVPLNESFSITARRVFGFLNQTHDPKRKRVGRSRGIRNRALRVAGNRATGVVHTSDVSANIRN